MQTRRIEFPVVDAVAGHNAIPDVEHEDGSDLLERPWAEAGFLVPTRSADGGAWRGGHLFRNEPGHKLPVSRLGVPQDREHIFYERQFRHPIRDPGESVSGRLYRSAGYAVRPVCELGLSEPERSGHDGGARRQHLPCGIWESSGCSPARSCSAWTTPRTEVRICRGPAQTTALSYLRLCWPRSPRR